MRLGVIDVGSNTVHLLVVDAHAGAHPLADSSHKEVLRLAEHLDPDGSINREGADRLVQFVRECSRVAEDRGAEELLAFATSATRDAPNAEEVLGLVEAECGVRLEVLTGEDESRATFLAARRWFGWSSGRLLLADIGGGSLELAAGIDEDPDVAVSLPLGAGRLTRALDGDPPGAESLRALRRDVRSQIARVHRPITKVGAPDAVVGTSKTIRSLARACGAAPRAAGPYVPRVLRRDDLAELVPRLARMNAEQRSALPGVSQARAAQLLAGAVVIEAFVDLFDVEQVDVCPWALREGLILRRLDLLHGPDQRPGVGSEASSLRRGPALRAVGTAGHP